MSETSVLPTAVADSGQAQVLPVPPPISPEKTLSAPQWGMVAFLLSETAFFGTLVVTYLSFLGKDQTGPTPAEALSLPLALCTTLCLLSSSATIHFAEGALHQGGRGRFRLWWALTIALGVAFLGGTAFEWYDLITRHQLTISRNLFGSTFYTLVGFHGFHVTAGVIAMLIVLGLATRGQVTEKNPLGVQLVAWYWHFVDGVWVVVFSVVYLFGR